jgi:CubicO group peptidase (beta-lactamase class C family)
MRTPRRPEKHRPEPHLGAPMKKILTSVAPLLMAVAARGADPAALPRSAPEAQGVSSAKVLAFVAQADRSVKHLHSVMVLRHGQVVAEGWWAPYDAATKHELYSLSKSFTSTAVGLAIAEGKLTLDDVVAKKFPQDAPAAPSRNLQALRLRDLLCMSTGHQSEANLNGSKEPWTKTFLAQPVPHKPGTHFMYNTLATYMQSALVQQATGQTVLEYLGPRLFAPLGIEGATWGTSPQGVSLGGYGLNLKTEDIAKFGQLLLQKGEWRGRQVLPAAWIAQATARQTANGSSPTSDWDQGYGFQFWRCRHNAFRGDGAFGQYCLVLPEQDAVVAITAGVGDMQGVLNLVWDQLLPAFAPTALPEAPADAARLRAKLAGLALPTPQPAVGFKPPAELSGKRFRFPANGLQLEELALGIDGNETTLIVKSAGRPETRLPCGAGTWKAGRIAFGGFPESPAAAAGAWTGERQFSAALCYRETPFVGMLTMKFEPGQMTLQTRWNVGFGNTSPPAVAGIAVP